jgi:hypothetical protein
LALTWKGHAENIGIACAPNLVKSDHGAHERKKVGVAMNYASIGQHLRPYIIVARRRTTINHAFAAAIAPADTYEGSRVRGAMTALRQDPDDALRCAYCGALADTWDHVFATVRASMFSGHGHRLGNLLPCCKPCNSKKGNKSWMQHLNSLDLDHEKLKERVEVIQAFLDVYGVVDAAPEHSPEYVELQKIREQVLILLQHADHLATIIRAQSRE